MPGKITTSAHDTSDPKQIGDERNLKAAAAIEIRARNINPRMRRIPCVAFCVDDDDNDDDVNDVVNDESRLFVMAKKTLEPDIGLR